jgi:hypothetical protein
MNMWKKETKRQLSNPEEKRTAVDIAGKNAIEREKLKDERITELQAQLDATKKGLAKALDTIDSLNRAEMIPIIKANYNIPDSEINALATDTMADMVETTRILKRSPYAASVRPGAEEEAHDARFTVPKKFKYGKEA